MSWLDFFSSSTPAGIAESSAKGVVTGIFDGVDKIIRDFKLPPEAQVAFEQFKTEQLGKIEAIAVEDRNSARTMQSATKSYIPGFLALLYTFAFISMSGACLWVSFAYPELQLSTFQASFVGMIFGAVSKEAMQATSFYLGSSSGSGDKTDIIAGLAQHFQQTQTPPKQ